MKISDIDFPRPLLDALRDGELVVFAGAGVSMGDPANLPNFRKLAEAVAQGAGENLKDDEPEDRFLGRLNKRRDTKVHERAAQVLSKNHPKPTVLHRDLLRLYSKQESTRIVTTNFDLLFEDAADGMFNHKPEVFRAPALPLGHDFNGIVHVHGSLSRPSGMVLTDADFGRAYLTEGWARRFLVELFHSSTVLFIGYSHGDTIMNYLARALSSEAKERFALTDEDDAGRWGSLGIKPIVYPRSDHRALYKSIHGLVDYATRGILDWQREITEIARKPPSLDKEETDLIEEALSDPVKVRFFTNAASSPEWIDWLDKRKHLASLFGVGELDERDRELASWLANKFAREHADALFLLIGQHGMSLHPDFWLQLSRTIGLEQDLPLDTDTLSRWVSLLLAIAPANPSDHVLRWLGKRCIERDMTDSLNELFNAMATSRLEIKPRLYLFDDDPDDSHPRIEVELSSISDHHWINELWEKGLKPNLDRVAEPLLARVVEHLTARHRRLSVWQAATRDYDPASFRRSAIEPHEQDRYPKTVDVLIDATRDCLEWLASHRPEVAAWWCDQLAGAEAPLLRRLAVHTLSMRQNLNPNEKIDWLLDRMDLHDLRAHHEMFQFLKQIYPEADPERREAVVEAILVYHDPDEEDENKEFHTARHHFDWLHWLHNAAPDCALAQKALDDVLERYPHIEPREYPDLLSWHGTSTGFQSPWTVEELLSRPAQEWTDELLSFQRTDFSGPDRGGLVLAVADAAKQSFQWGLTLADMLAEDGKWDIDLWDAILRAWCDTELDEKQCRKILQRLHETELHRKHPRLIADFLYGLVKNGGKPYVPDLLQQANQISANLWRGLDRDETLKEFHDWLTRAINHAGGVLAQFWLGSLSLWREPQDPKPDALSGDYLDALSGIVQDESFAGKLGRSVLANQLSFLLAVDEKWAKENLLPLFKQDENADDYLAVWDGFLYGRLNPPVAELMEGAFLEAVSRIKSDFSDVGRRDRFIEAYTTMLAYFAENPLDAWIPRFFNNAGEEGRNHFALEFGRHLHGLNEERQQEWWGRWLKRYWENRLKGVPIQLDSGEIEEMLNWLPYLKGEMFREAVDLAVQMPQAPLQHGLAIYEIAQSALWQSHPEAVARLLIHLGGCDSPLYVWRPGGQKLIEKLLDSNIPQDRKKELEELRARLGLQ